MLEHQQASQRATTNFTADAVNTKSGLDIPDQTRRLKPWMCKIECVLTLRFSPPTTNFIIEHSASSHDRPTDK